MWLAMSKARRGRLQECIELCDGVLTQNPADQVDSTRDQYFVDFTDLLFVVRVDSEMSRSY